MSTRTIIGRLVEISDRNYDPIEGALEALAGIGTPPKRRRQRRRLGRAGYELWWIETRGMIYKTRSGRLPKLIPRSARGWVVVLRCDVEPWHNGLGAYIRRVQSCQVTEHTDLTEAHTAFGIPITNT